MNCSKKNHCFYFLLAASKEAFKATKIFIIQNDTIKIGFIIALLKGMIFENIFSTKKNNPRFDTRRTNLYFVFIFIIS